MPNLCIPVDTRTLSTRRSACAECRVRVRAPATARQCKSVNTSHTRTAHDSVTSTGAPTLVLHALTVLRNVSMNGADGARLGAMHAQAQNTISTYGNFRPVFGPTRGDRARRRRTVAPPRFLSTRSGCVPRELRVRDGALGDSVRTNRRAPRGAAYRYTCAFRRPSAGGGGRGARWCVREVGA